MQLYQFQKDALKNISNKHILAWDTGVGKSYSSLAHYENKAYPKPLLVLCPATKKDDWQRDIAVWFSGKSLPEYKIYSYEKFGRKPTAAQIAKTGTKGVWRDWLNQYQDFAMIADECHKIANSQSLSGQGAFHCAKSAAFFFRTLSNTLAEWLDRGG